MAIVPKYRIIEVKQHGRVWFEVHRCTPQCDMRGESWDDWTRVENDKDHETVAAARQYRDILISSVRHERVVE